MGSNRRITRLHKAARFIGLALLSMCVIRVGFWHVENDIREAAYRYAFDNLGHRRSTWKASFIAVSYGCSFSNDSVSILTTPFLLNRFTDCKPSVKSNSECFYDDRQHQIADIKTNKTGVVFHTGAIWWLSHDTVKIEVGYYQGMVSSSGNIYTLKRKNGRWVVVDDRILFVS